MANDDLARLVRTIPDFPKPGIQFRDITTLLADPWGLRETVERMAALAGPGRYDLVAGIEARGFILAGALSVALGAGFLPVRKAGKLPGRTVGVDYALEYGTDRLEVHDGQIPAGAQVLLVDDLIATGGTALAAAQLIEGQGGYVAGALFVIDLPELGGLAALLRHGVTARALIDFAGH